ncbi:MAG: alpha/beta hydrolase [Chloroflexota bacterium]
MSNSTVIFSDDRGQGDLPVVFLHSLAGNSSHWEAQLAHASQTTRAIAFDLPGHGRSIFDQNHPINIKSMVKGVYDALDELNISKFVLVGHSMGGAIAAEYAGSYPMQLAGLLLVDPSGDSTQMPQNQIEHIVGLMESPAYDEFMTGYWDQLLVNATVDTRTKILDDFQHTSKETVIQMTKALFAYNPMPALNRYHGPKQIVYVPTFETAGSIHNQRSDIPSSAIEGVSHWLQLDRPENFNNLLSNFINTI